MPAAACFSDGVSAASTPLGLECTVRKHFACVADLMAFCSEENGKRQIQAGGEVACFQEGCKGHFSTRELALLLPPVRDTRSLGNDKPAIGS